MKTKRTARIESLADGEAQEVKRVSFAGTTMPLPVIRCDVKDDVMFNPNLGRLILEREGQGAVLQLDAPDLQDRIYKHILAQKESKELEQHISSEGQLEPGIIARDGTVINGNRRLAVLRKLLADTGDEEYRYINVAVLPKDASPKAMYLLEVNLQMTPETRARYGPFTALVQIRWGLEHHKLAKKEVAHAMYLEEGAIDERLEVLALADEYLAFIKQRKNYRLLERGWDESDTQGKYEHFVTVRQLKKRHGGMAYWEAFLRHIFQLIRGERTYDDLREIKKWKTEDVGAFAKRFSVGAVKSDAPTPPPSALDGLASDLAAVQATLTNQESVDANALKPPQGPKTPGEDVSEDPTFEKTVDAFEWVNQQVFAERNEARPALLLRQALTKLEAASLVIGLGKAKQTPAELRAILTEISELVKVLDGRLDGN